MLLTTDNLIRVLLAGLFFGLWPLFLSKSGLNVGNASTFYFAIVTLAIVLAFTFQDAASVAGARWGYLVAAAAASAAGVILFNRMLASAGPKEVGSYFVIMVLVQISIPVIYDVALSAGKIPPARLAGFACAVAAAVLLTMKVKPAD